MIKNPYPKMTDPDECTGQVFPNKQHTAWQEGFEAASKVNNTKKQVVSGYHRPVCVKCHCEMRPEINGVGVLDMADWGPYQLFDADQWCCPNCHVQMVGGFGSGPIAKHFEPDFQKMVADYDNRGLLIRNTG
jgi:hypothetical protein